MKKNRYSAPDIMVTTIETNLQLLTSSPTSTNVEGLGISETAATEDQEGRARSFNVWGDED